MSATRLAAGSDGWPLELSGILSDEYTLREQAHTGRCAPSPGDRTLSNELVMYTTTRCGYCVRLKGFFVREGIAHREVNIEYDAEAADFVQSANRGNYTVPTVVFPGGEVLTNPTPAQVLARVEPSA
jgi:mycoredoxin